MDIEHKGTLGHILGCISEPGSDTKDHRALMHTTGYLDMDIQHFLMNQNWKMMKVMGLKKAMKKVIKKLVQ